MNFHNIKRLKGFQEKTMTTKIFVTRSNKRIAVEEKVNIEKECTRENIKKFTQTNNTSPMSNTFRKLMGRWGETKAAQSVLDRNFITPESTNPHLVELLKFMKMPKSIAEDSRFRMRVDTEDNTKFWRKQKAKT